MSVLIEQRQHCLQINSCWLSQLSDTLMILQFYTCTVYSYSCSLPWEHFTLYSSLRAMRWSSALSAFIALSCKWAWFNDFVRGEGRPLTSSQLSRLDIICVGWLKSLSSQHPPLSVSLGTSTHHMVKGVIWTPKSDVFMCCDNCVMYYCDMSLKRIKVQVCIMYHVWIIVTQDILWNLSSLKPWSFHFFILITALPDWIRPSDFLESRSDMT